jgi:hypothetical protein
MDDPISKPLNPYHICSWNAEADCKGCHAHKDLNCRFSFKDLMQFYSIFLPFAIPAIMGVRQSGYTSYLFGWILMAVVFFGFWEIYILCSHCPYYALKGFTIKCHANYGCPKIWRYQPGPITKSKKIQLVIGFIVMSGYPFVFMILGNEPVYFALSLAGLLLFFGALFKFKCTKCINFSCIFNRVPKHNVDAYLRRNPIMAKAWKDAGWRREETGTSKPVVGEFGD